MIQSTTRVPRPFHEYALVGVVSARSYVFHVCPEEHHLELLGPGWACHECRKLWAMNDNIFEEWQKPEACGQGDNGWACVRPADHDGLCAAFEMEADERVVLTPEESESVYSYIRGDGFDANMIGNVLEKLEPVVFAKMREQEVD